MNLFDHTLLRVGQRKRQQILVEVVEPRTNNRHHKPVGLLPPCRSTTQYRQLVVEQLLELQPFAGFLHRTCVLRKMYLMHRLRPVHQVVALNDIRLQGLRQPAIHVRHKPGNDRTHSLGVQPAVLHPLGGVVVRLQTAHHLRSDFRHWRQFRVNEIVRPVEPRRLTEQQVRYAYLQFKVLYPLEPHQLYLRMPVAEHSRHTLRLADTHCVVLHYLTFDLNERILILYLMDKVEP